MFHTPHEFHEEVSAKADAIHRLRERTPHLGQRLLEMALDELHFARD